MDKKAYAKINFNLNVYEKQMDGFHFMQSYMQKVSLYDEMSFAFKSWPTHKVQIEVENMPDLSNEKNIAVKAAQLYLQEAKDLSPTLVDIKIKKNIFMAAGMAGGSSNAASTLLAMNEQLHAFDQAALLILAEKLGSDVPFFIHDEDLMYVEGRGTECKPEKSLPAKPLLLVNPMQEISTAQIYQGLNRGTEVLPKHIHDTVESWQDIAAIVDRGNDMQSHAEMVCPKIKVITEKLRKQAGCQQAQMSGSGATVWALFADEALACKAGEVLKNDGNVIFTWTGTSSCFKRL